MAVSRFSDVDEYGFKREPNFDYASYENIMSNYYTTLTKRRMKWDKFLKTKPNLHNNKSAKLRRYIRKGIPGNLRGEIWMHISGGFDLMKKSPNLYKSLLNTQHDIDIVEAIRVDIPRTFPENIFFDNIKVQLFNVLLAYANHNKEVAYCQGLNYIAGLLLIVTKNEEWTFWLLKIMVENTTKSYHTKSMGGLIADIGVLRELLKQRIPDVCQHLDNYGLPCAVITTKWFICLFAEVLPVETVLRIWDCMFAEGYKILFRVSLTLFIIHRQEILQCDDMTALGNLFRDLSKNPRVTNCHEFLQNIFIVPGRLKRSEIERLRSTGSTSEAFVRNRRAIL